MGLEYGPPSSTANQLRYYKRRGTDLISAFKLVIIGVTCEGLLNVALGRVVGGCEQPVIC